MPAIALSITYIGISYSARLWYFSAFTIRPHRLEVNWKWARNVDEVGDEDEAVITSIPSHITRATGVIKAKIMEKTTMASANHISPATGRRWISNKSNDSVWVNPAFFSPNYRQPQAKCTLRENQVGITEFTNPDLPGFTGVLKSRFSDFHVNEIDSTGHVLQLNDLKVPKPEIEREWAQFVRVTSS